MFAEYFFAI